MPTVMKFVADEAKEPPKTSNQSFLMTLSRDEIATVCKAALLWDVEKERALEILIAGSVMLIRECLPVPGPPHPPEIH